MLMLIIGRVIQVLLTVAQIRLATTILDPSEYGTIVLLHTTATLFILFGISPLGLYLNRHIIEWQAKGILPSIFQGYNLYMLGFSLLMTVMTCLFIEFDILKITELSMMSVATLICLLMFTQTFHQTWVPSLNFLGDRRGYIIGSVANILISILIVLSLKYFGLSGVLWWMLSVSVGFLISALLMIPKGWYAKSSVSFISNLNLKDIFAFSAPLLFTTVFSWCQGHGSRLVIDSRMGVAELGKFAAGYSVVAGLFVAVEMIISNFYQANFFKKINAGNSYVEELGHIWKIGFYPYLLSGGLLFLIAPEISMIFLGDKFTTRLEWLSLVVFSEGARIIFSLISTHYHGKKQTKNLVIPQLCGLLLSAVLIFSFHELTFPKIIFALGSGYLLASAGLILMDFKTYVTSGLFTQLFLAILAGGIFVLLGQIISGYSEGPVKVMFICFLAFVFVVPYLRKILKEKYE